MNGGAHPSSFAALSLPDSKRIPIFCWVDRVGWLVVLGLTALQDCISVCIGPSPREREKETRKDR